MTTTASAVPARTDGRLVNPSAERNKHVIRQVLAQYLPPSGTATGQALEVSSGTGQHTALFASTWPGIHWQPTEFDANALPSIDAYRAQRAADLKAAGATAACNIGAPFTLDVCSAADVANNKVAAASVDVVVNINMLHIAPPAALAGLMRVAAHALRSHGLLLTYGPYNVVDDTFTTLSNARFDRDYLKHLNPHYGIRNLSAVKHAAAQHGLRFVRAHPVPSANFVLVFVRHPTAAVTNAAAVAAGAVAAVTAVATFVASAAANDAGSGAGIAVGDRDRDRKPTAAASSSSSSPASASAASSGAGAVGATTAEEESLEGDSTGATSLGVALSAAVAGADAVCAALLKAEADAKAKADAGAGAGAAAAAAK